MTKRKTLNRWIDQITNENLKLRRNTRKQEVEEYRHYEISL